MRNISRKYEKFPPFIPDTQTNDIRISLGGAPGGGGAQVVKHPPSAGVMITESWDGA